MATRLGVAASLWQTEHPDIPSLSVPGMEPSAVVVGAGPGIGLAVARRFAREGFAVALIARRQDALDGYVLELLGEHDVVLGVAADAADPAALEGAWATVVAALGDPEVLVYNAMGARPLGAPTTLDIDDLRATLDVNVGGALLAVSAGRPGHARRRPGHDGPDRGRAGARADGRRFGAVDRQGRVAQPHVLPGPGAGARRHPRRDGDRVRARSSPAPTSTPTGSPTSTGSCTPSHRRHGRPRSPTADVARRSEDHHGELADLVLVVHTACSTAT